MSIALSLAPVAMARASITSTICLALAACVPSPTIIDGSTPMRPALLDGDAYVVMALPRSFGSSGKFVFCKPGSNGYFAVHYVQQQGASIFCFGDEKLLLPELTESIAFGRSSIFEPDRRLQIGSGYEVAIHEIASTRPRNKNWTDGTFYFVAHDYGTSFTLVDKDSFAVELSHGKVHVLGTRTADGFESGTASSIAVALREAFPDVDPGRVVVQEVKPAELACAKTGNSLLGTLKLLCRPR